jgi:hypothetical protein
VGQHREVTHAKRVELSIEAGAALRQILGIMTDQLMLDEPGWGWDFERLLELDARLETAWPDDQWQTTSGAGAVIALDIEDAALLLDGMAYTEVASADLPWVEMVRWTSDFVTAELRQHWSDEEWSAFHTSTGRRMPY